MPTNNDRIKQLEQRVEEVTRELEQVASERVRLQAERDGLVKARDAISVELEKARAELDQLQVERPALTFDQLGTQLRQGLAAVDDVGGENGPRYQAKGATFELKVAIETDGEQAVLRLPAIGDAVDPDLLGSFKLELGRANEADADLTGMVLVPTVTGATSDGAFARLASSGLAVGETAERPAFAPPGSVVDQDPEGGSYVEPGTAIDLVLAATEVPIPDLIGLTLGAARDRLSSVRLEVGEVSSVPSEDAAPGTIVSQSPAAGKAAIVGSSVAVEFASRPVREVPDLSGMTVAEAKDALAEVELELGRTDQQPSEAEPGRIVGQRPAAGSVVEKETAVNVVVAKARIRRAAPVPDVVGLPLGEAEKALRAADFVGRVSGTRPFADGESRRIFGSVVDQDPRSGTPSTAAEVSLVVVASGDSATTLPGVGRALAERLAVAGLRTVGDIAHSDPALIQEAIGGKLQRATDIRDAAVRANHP